MKYLLWFLLCICGRISIVYSQILYPEVMEKQQIIVSPLKVPDIVFPHDLSALKKTLKNTFIENPAVRYALESVKQDDSYNKELQEALNILIRHAEDEHVQPVVEAVKKYMAEAGEKEIALRKAIKQMETDSMDYYNCNPYYQHDTTIPRYYNSPLKTLVSHIRNDSNYIWLREISKDSVEFHFSNSAAQQLDLWMNTGRPDYHRFWLINRSGDSIGTWIQVLPETNNVRLYVDDDVYQSHGVDYKKAPEALIKNQPGDDYYKINDLHRGELWRRHWSQYAEIEAAIGQGYLSNWASGGENSLSFLTNIRYFINYNKNKTSWENLVHYRLGFLRSGSEDIRKNEDRLELNSKLGQNAFKHWYYTIQLNIVTQLFNSYEYPNENERNLVANFMSPGYYTLSIGIDYKPSGDFSLYLSPLAGKWTWVRDTNGIDPTRYGVEEGKKSKGDAGAQVKLINKFPLLKIMDVRNELTLFSSYYEPKQSFTADWKVQIDFKINYFMRASVYANLIYDENYSDKLQFKETLNLGVNFRF
ncbi:DUF3078 domain-containing protein [Odoribacter lunatus]|uniref:DUF3078 domain-containing protein n=1 Tax=Odoribacter lunatus TaxID=2941335 RepID=UPI002042479C|nr:DUF3078 domain-containing protein [Odoribacter lunatus]